MKKQEKVDKMLELAIGGAERMKRGGSWLGAI